MNQTTITKQKKESHKTCPNCKSRNVLNTSTGRCVWCKWQQGQAVDGKFRQAS